MSQAKKLLNKQLEEQTKLNDKHEMQKDKLANELIEDLKLLGRYVETQVTNDEEIERLYEENARHIKRINELAAENERLVDETIELEGQIAFKDGQIFGLNKQIEELQAKINELTNDKLDSIVKKHVEGDDAMEQPEVQPKKKPSKLDMIKKLPKTKEFSLKDANEEIKTQTKEEVKEETKEIEINWTQDVFDKKVNSFSCMMMGVHGDITIKDKTYNFKARREYYMPIIYGCFDERVVEQAREEINKIDRFRLASERTTNDVDLSHAKDEKYPIVVWPVLDGNGNVNAFGAYTKAGRYSYVLTIDMAKLKSNNIYVGRKLVDHLFTDKDNQWRKLTNTELADKFIAICKERWPERFTNDNNDSQITKEQHQPTKEVSQDTNEIVVDFTNDKNVTDKTNDEDATDVTNEDPTAGCEDLDI